MEDSNFSQQVKGGRGRAGDNAWAHRMLLQRGGGAFGCRATPRLKEDFTLDEIEVLITTDVTSGKVPATNTAIKNIERTARGHRNAANYTSVIL